MKTSFIKIAAVLSALLAPGLTAVGWAYMGGMRGAAEVGYVKYDAEVAGHEVVSGNSLAQKYSLDYHATNLVSKSQARYYDLMLGYDWMSFDTTVSDPQQELKIKQSFGKVKYSGNVGFTAADLPITINAYSSDTQPASLKSSIAPYELIPDGLIYGIEGRGSYVISGITFAFLPEFARDASIRALPRLLLDYRQTINKNTEGGGFSRIDNRTRELAVAGLNQQNNWLNYRMTSFEDNLNSFNNFTRQQLQIGLVDQHGDRKWSALTNWIEVSADGQLTNTRSPKSDTAFEEYDVNFMAIATRKLWNASTFMNYNRQIDANQLTETAKVPVFVKGIYGSETDWYVSLAAIMERQKLSPQNTQNSFNTSSGNSISVGGTTFNRSSFTLSPSISLSTDKSYAGVDSYMFTSSLETASTSRFSDKLGLAGKFTFRAADNGSSAPDSKTWSTVTDLGSTYTPNSKISNKLQEVLEMGSGSAYLEGGKLLYGAASSARVGTYLRNFLSVSSSWVPTAQFSSALGISYAFLKVTDLDPSSITTIYLNAGYGNQDTSYRFDSKYVRGQNGYDPARHAMITNAEIQYRPNRYHDGLFRLNYQTQVEPGYDRTQIGVLQRYTYNLFNTTGQLRNIATLTEESGYNSDDNFGVKSSFKYLSFSARYNPTERLSLYGSVKYEKNIPGSLVLYYNAGMSADFKLLSTSLDYAYAKRDSDNRIEKRLSAYVRRQF